MSKKTIIIGLVVVALVAAGALAAVALSDDDTATPQSFTAADSGASITLAPGESFTVSLTGNPTTGYSWEVAELDAAVLETGEPVYEVGSDLMGAGGTYTWTFTAVAAGEAQLELVYHRAWEQAEPLETFTLEVTVS